MLLFCGCSIWGIYTLYILRQMFPMPFRCFYPQPHLNPANSPDGKYGLIKFHIFLYFFHFETDTMSAKQTISVSEKRRLLFQIRNDVISDILCLFYCTRINESYRMLSIILLSGCAITEESRYIPFLATSSFAF